MTVKKTVRKRTIHELCKRTQPIYTKTVSALFIFIHKSHLLNNAATLIYSLISHYQIILYIAKSNAKYIISLLFAYELETMSNTQNKLKGKSIE